MTCAFERFDPPPVEYQNFSSEFEIWLSQLIDSLNAFVENLENCLPLKYAGKINNGGGSATIVQTVTGVLPTDLAFAQVQNSTNSVSVYKVTPTSDTLTILLSGDPGANTVLSYQVLRV